MFFPVQSARVSGPEILFTAIGRITYVLVINRVLTRLLSITLGRHISEGIIKLNRIFLLQRLKIFTIQAIRCQ